MQPTRMTPEQWLEFAPYFTFKECGDMDYGFMRGVLALRKSLNTPMYVIDGAAASGHSVNSYHYAGRALDFWVKKPVRYTMALIDECALFGGVGFYPWGAHDSFHIDNRPLQIYQRWVSPSKGEYLYLLKDRKVNY